MKVVKASSMVNFAYIMLVVNLIATGVFAAMNDRGRMVMCMLGCVVWIVCALIWSKHIEPKDIEP